MMTSLVDSSHKSADAYALHVAYTLFKLKTCRVQHEHFCDRHAQHLARAIEDTATNGSKKLRKLELYKCSSLTANGISVLAQALASSKVDRLDIASAGMGDQGLQDITRWVENSSVQCISLEDVGPISIPAWNTFLESALRSPTLKSLDLSRNDLSQEHMLVLARGLEHNTILTSLVLSENPIGDEGLKLLCLALRQNPSLVLLALGNCEISDKGTQALTHCLRTNCHLERLYLYANPLDYSSPEKSEQVYWLDLNARGRAYLRREDCRLELISRILSRANESPELVYGLLKELPHVWTPRT
jgi:hypothetical protein